MDEEYKILVIDDEPDIRSLFEDVLSDNGCMVATCGSGREGVEMVSKSSFDVVISDIKMPDLSGIDVLRSIKNINSEIGVILITGYASVQTAIDAIRLGADEYLKKPFEDLTGQVVQTVKKTAERYRLVRENRCLVNDLNQANQNLKKNNVAFRKMIARVSAIQQTSRIINVYPDLELMLQVAEDALVGFDVERYAILLSGQDGRMRIVKNHHDIINTDRFQITPGEGPIGEAIMCQVPTAVSHYKNDPAYIGAPIVEGNETDAFLMLPLVAVGELVGAIMICSMVDNKPYDAETIDAFSILASVLSAPIALARTKMGKVDI